MENYFKPVHSLHGHDETKPRQHHHHLHHHRNSRSNRYMVLDDTDRSHRQSVHDDLHHNVRPCHQSHVHHKEEILYKNKAPVALSRASSSSLSSSSSTSSSSSPSSFSSWYTDGDANNPYSLHHVVQQQHSQSCSNIADVRRGFREDSGSEPVVFATIKQGKNTSVFSQLHGSQETGKPFSSLDRGHSRSEEALQQDNVCMRGERQSREPHVTSRPLYKTASLNRGLTFSTEDILLGVSGGPKRAVSSSQLPSKGILKNKEPHTDIRKAKSMEVLSPRLSKGQDPSGQKGKGITQAETEQARANFVQGKLQFSAFLDEITKQVMSASHLSNLGVNHKAAGKTAALPQPCGPVKPQLPPKNYRKSSGEDRESNPERHSRQENSTPGSSRKHSDSSNADKLLSYTAKAHQGSPPPHSYPHHPRHNTRSRKERRASPIRGSLPEDGYTRSGLHVTDGTSTSPEPTQPKLRHHRKQPPAAPYTQHPQPFILPQPQQVPTAGPGQGSESSSTRSDSSRTRDTASTATSHSLELGYEHHSPSVGHCKQCRATPCDGDHFRALQEENADLHQNLLQTVVCIESLEEELQRTRDELSRVKEKYKSLLETHSGTKQANNLLGEHLHIASESLSSERKYLLTRVSQLGCELEDAHTTIAALENIKVPCLMKELLQKHLNSSVAVASPVAVSHSAATPAGGLTHALKVEAPAQKWLMESEAGPQRVTAFTPFKQEVPQFRNDHILGQRESNHSPPFTLEDLSADIYRKISARYAARPQPLYPQSLTSNHADKPPNSQQAHMGDDGWAGKGGAQVTLLEEDMVDVTSMSAQKILEEFMRQLQPHQEIEKRRQEKMAAEERTDKGAD
ncbi:uncharacterized protein si:ch211-276i12.4 [Takifugu flavidus]|uniref:uncharacterized protein si:ch211-276i12.4 n=1 Tax=Takifugu flavidus TaxID=433684 RepID=UPI0025447F8D|nr:uncharacterized protein si:ch211-276i12.4 [Takifugu flavidus]